MEVNYAGHAVTVQFVSVSCLCRSMLCAYSQPSVVHVSSCCITASALCNVVVPTQVDQDDRSGHELCWEVTVKFMY